MERSKRQRQRQRSVLAGSCVCAADSSVRTANRTTSAGKRERHTKVLQREESFRLCVEVALLTDTHAWEGVSKKGKPGRLASSFDGGPIEHFQSTLSGHKNVSGSLLRAHIASLQSPVARRLKGRGTPQACTLPWLA